MNNINESINNIEDLKKHLNSNDIINFRRIGKIGTIPRKMILTFNTYGAKINMLNNYKFVTENFTKSNFDSNFERIQTRFCKYVRNISKFESNHGIRPELGRYP